ncbi:MAG: uracil-DNA glycosylase [SAR202 cluster bacterium]|nr:uracil-DNA glycosylase [SAR202 cluster bacterium]|tara:strand:- start:561 stop:1253 length:693 start_codon:yes stop_codon:yes gene_type:complete
MVKKTYNQQQLKDKIESCKKCRRLTHYRKLVFRDRPIRFQNESYWNKPVYGFGDSNAELLILGSAPAAHGANRTGRVFTGDKSSDFLMKYLNKHGLANLAYSNNLEDGLKLNNTYITDIIRCAPPNDKPTGKEIENCRNYLINELSFFPNLKLVLALGKVAFDNYLKTISISEEHKYTEKFSHRKLYQLSDHLPLLMACYHPSPRNTNTGRLTEQDFDAVIQDTADILKK